MSLEIIVGPMFSGKTSYALTYINRLKAIGKRVLVIKPNIDTRYSDDMVIVSHNNIRSESFVWDIRHPLVLTTDADHVVIEEAQFFKGLLDCVRKLLLVDKKNILLIGLDGDMNQNMFGEVLHCVPYCSKITKLAAFCSICKDGTLAYYTKAINRDMMDEQIDIGGADKYISVCLKHNG